jgi:hypothetical protein
MVLVARDQHNGVVVAAGIRGVDSDLSTVIDLPRLIYLQAGVGRDQGIQVHHGAAIVRKECRVAISVPRAAPRNPDYLSRGVDRLGEAAV